MLTKNFSPANGWTVWLTPRLTSGIDKSGVVDRSGVLGLGGLAQEIAPASPLRAGFLIQNLSAGDLWVNDSGAAAVGSPSLRVSAGQTFTYPADGAPLTAISLFGAVTGQAFTAREW